ncbi:MAG: hypothetical protein U0132_02145 [Gemmatimonadaceae bacterium]
MKSWRGGDIGSGWHRSTTHANILCAIDAHWGAALDSGGDISPGYFSTLFTSFMALLVFRGELKSAGDMALMLAASIAAKGRGEPVELLKGAGAFHRQDVNALQVLVNTAHWYQKNNDLYRKVVGFPSGAKG